MASSWFWLLTVLFLSTSTASPLRTLEASVKSSRSETNTTEATYQNHSQTGIQALQGYYNKTSGLWGNNLWWNSANCLQALTDWAIVDKAASTTVSVESIVSNTFTNAQNNKSIVQKTISDTGLVTSFYTLPNSDVSLQPAAQPLAKRDGPYPGFINNYYDDEGWWALAWIRSWDLFGTPDYLSTAKKIFADMQKGETPSACGGGIWWSKNNTYKNAISNELYLAVAASLANRVQGGSVDYKGIAISQWNWFKNSGMINARSNINDGLVILANGTCVNNNATAWSYNQGVVIGGLVELAKATNDTSYLDEASKIALAGISLLSDESGIIHDICEPNCGGDASQFKGIFLRNLASLYNATPGTLGSVRTSILLNADSVWNYDRNDKNQFGVNWSGPPQVGGGPNATTTSSALGSLIAALSVV